MSLLHPVLEEAKISLETCQPGISTRVDPSEVFVIAFFTQTPSCCEENFHEEMSTSRLIHLCDQIKPRVKFWPCNVNLLPASFTEWAGEDHIVHYFFNLLSTEKAVKNLTNVVVTTLRHVPCVRAIEE